MRLLLLAALLLAPLAALASDGIGGTDGIGRPEAFRSAAPDPQGGESFSAPPDPPVDAPPVPVDGGLALLAVAGAGYAARRLRRR